MILLSQDSEPAGGRRFARQMLFSVGPYWSEPNQAPERNDHEPSFFDGFSECFSCLFSVVVVAHL
jgi:hypothetical protein